MTVLTRRLNRRETVLSAHALWISGKFSGELLVGNFGNGRINTFAATPDGWEPRGPMKGTDHRPVFIDGLWGIGFGNGGASGPLTTLYFAAGPADETEGLFGSITAPAG